MTSRLPICSSAALAILCAATLAGGPAGPSVSGRVELRDSRDPAVRSHHDFSGVVISLKPLSANSPVRPAHAVMTQKDKMFAPHILTVPVGSTVDFPNLDPIFHNAFSSYNGQIFDVGLYAPGTSRSVRFAREGVVRVFCNIHSSMSALIVVLATPYFATSKRDGTFEIDGVPEGEYELSVFHERATEAELAKQRKRITVSPGGLALSPVTLSEAGYLSIPHKNKYGRDYQPEPDGHIMYPGLGR